MKILENGIYRELTQDEVNSINEQMTRHMEALKNKMPTPEERLEALESAMLALLGGV